MSSAQSISGPAVAPDRGYKEEAPQRLKVGIFNSTGRHAGTVLRAVKARDNFDVRAMVSNTSDPKSQQLKDEGFEVVQVDLASRDSIRKAIKGLHAVFFSQNSFRIGHDAELRNAKNVAFVAREPDVKLKLIINLCAIVSISALLTYPRSEVAGEQELCDRKWEISEYLRTSKTPFCDLELGWYLDHFEKEMAPQYENDEYVFRASIPKDAKLPWVNVDDLGPIAAAIFEDSNAWLGKRIQIAGEIASMDQFIQTFNKVTKKKARYDYIPANQQTNLDARQDLLMSFYMLFASNEPYADLNMLRKMHPGLKDIASWLSQSKFMSQEQV